MFITQSPASLLYMNINLFEFQGIRELPYYKTNSLPFVQHYQKNNVNEHSSCLYFLKLL